LVMGRPAACQPIMPSATLCACQPAPTRARAARSERCPDRQITYTAPARSISGYRAPSSRRGMCRAPGTCPASHSSASRTSSTNASAGTSAAGTCSTALSWSMGSSEHSAAIPQVPSGQATAPGLRPHGPRGRSLLSPGGSVWLAVLAGRGAVLPALAVLAPLRAGGDFAELLVHGAQQEEQRHAHAGDDQEPEDT